MPRTRVDERPHAARYGAVADHTARVDRPLVLAGDCLTSVGTLAGVQRRRGNLSIIWLDAHGDFNTPEISVSGYLAGMSLAAATGRVPPLVAPSRGLTTQGHVDWNVRTGQPRIRS